MNFRLLVFLTLCATSAFAQPLNSEKLNAYFDALESSDKFMGTVAIFRDGNQEYVRSTGYASIEDNRRASAETKYRIGSISKTFTAVLILKATEEKKLKLDQKIDRFFPEIRNAGKITIRHLLQHRSGIHNFTDDSDYLTYNTQAKTEKEMIAIITKAGIDFEPDEKAQYSNSNYVLLSYILEKIYKKQYGAILKEKITDPANLKNTWFAGKTTLEKGESFSYKYNTKWTRESQTDMSIPMGAGGIVSTASDIASFATALFTGKIITPASVNLMKEIRENYGMGLFQFPFHDKKAFGHTGGIDGFTSVFGYFEQEKVAFVVLSNGTNFVNNDISIAILSEVFGVPYEIPSFKKFEVSAELLEEYEGTYSSQQIPLLITIKRNDKQLTAQATGQPSFPLEASAKDVFRFDPAGVTIEFRPASKEMLLKQRGGNYLFKKQ